MRSDTDSTLPFAAATPVTRRGYLAGLLVFASPLAGCSGVDDPKTPTATATYDHLTRRRVYVGGDVSLVLPERIGRADDPEDADVVILRGSTDVGAKTAIGWLTADKDVALLGSEAEATVIEWIRSDAAEAPFESTAYSDATPDPDFLIAFAVGSKFVSTHRYSWGDAGSPTDAEILGAIEDALADRPTPQERDTGAT